MNTLPLPNLQHDCNACSALCCVVLPFDKDQGFGFDKAALTPCTHLREDFLCGIHRELDTKGFKGCIHYGCHGAGQRVTRAFGEVNWRSHPDRANEIYAMFSRMQSLHALQALLQTALGVVADAGLQQKLAAQQRELEQHCLALEKQQMVDTDSVIAQTRVLLRQLATEPKIVALAALK